MKATVEKKLGILLISEQSLDYLRDLNVKIKTNKRKKTQEKNKQKEEKKTETHTWYTCTQIWASRISLLINKPVAHFKRYIINFLPSFMYKETNTHPPFPQELATPSVTCHGFSPSPLRSYCGKHNKNGH